MAKCYFGRLKLEKRSSVKDEMWELEYMNPLVYLNTKIYNEQNMQEFVSTLRSMLAECSLVIERKDRTYRTSLTIPYDDVYGYRTFGYIFQKDFFLDCMMVCDRMYKSRKRKDLYKQEFFNRMVRARILKPPYLHPLRYRWLEQHGNVALQEDNKFYLISNSILQMKLTDFSDIVQYD